MQALIEITREIAIWCITNTSYMLFRYTCSFKKILVKESNLTSKFKRGTFSLQLISDEVFMARKRYALKQEPMTYRLLAGT